MTLRHLPVPGLSVLAIAAFTPSVPAQQVVTLPAEDRPLDAAFEDVFRIGAVTGESWEMLGTVRSVAFDADGNLYVFDGTGGVGGPWVDPRILVYDASGAFIREFGRSGEGPGEFNSAVSMEVMRDGTVAISDAGHRAYQIFDESGSFLRMVRVGMEDFALLIPTQAAADPRGNGLYAIPSRGRSAMARGPDAPEPVSRPILRLNLEGEEVTVDTVAEGWLPPPPATSDGVVPGVVVEGRAVTFAELGLGQSTVFEPELVMAVLPGGQVAYSDSSAYSLKVAGDDGAPTGRVITRPLEPQRVTPAIEEAERERMQAGRRALGGSGRTRMIEVRGADGSVQSSTYDLPEPAFFPELSVIHALSATWEGRIWVQRRGNVPGDRRPHRRGDPGGGLHRHVSGWHDCTAGRLRSGRSDRLHRNGRDGRGGGGGAQAARDSAMR